MAILAECRVCGRVQSRRNKICKCGENLDKQKRGRRVKYWIDYRTPGGKQRREPVAKFEGLDPYSIKDAKDIHSKRMIKRKEQPFDTQSDPDLTFIDIFGWYLNLKSVKKLAAHDRYEDALNNFSNVFGGYRLIDIKQTDLVDYQDLRKEQGRADSTVDLEIKIAKAAVQKAFDNDKIDGHCLKAFRRTKPLVKGCDNARKVLISMEQYSRLLNHATSYFKPVLIIAFNTGMRSGEIKKLRWSFIDKEKNMIRLPKEVTKESRDKDIPINHNVRAVLDSLPRSIVHDFVITYRGNPVTDKNSLRQQFPITCREADIAYGTKVRNGIIFYDIRRTVKTNMVQAGLDKVYRDAILGHSLQGMDRHYVIVTDETLTDAMVKYTKWLDRQLNSINVDQTLTKANF